MNDNDLQNILDLQKHSTFPPSLPSYSVLPPIRLKEHKPAPEQLNSSVSLPSLPVLANKYTHLHQQPHEHNNDELNRTHKVGGELYMKLPKIASRSAHGYNISEQLQKAFARESDGTPAVQTPETSRTSAAATTPPTRRILQLSEASTSLPLSSESTRIEGPESSKILNVSHAPLEKLQTPSKRSTDDDENPPEFINNRVEALTHYQDSEATPRFYEDYDPIAPFLGSLESTPRLLQPPEVPQELADRRELTPDHFQSSLEPRESPRRLERPPEGSQTNRDTPGSSQSLPEDGIRGSRRRSTIYPFSRTNLGRNSAFYNLNDIPDNEELRATSSGSTSSLMDSLNDRTQNRKYDTDIFQVFQVISLDDTLRIADRCKAADPEQSGQLPAFTLAKIVSEETDQADGIWSTMQSIAPDNQLVEYETFFQIIVEEKLHREYLASLPDFLEEEGRADLVDHLPSRPSSVQAMREQQRRLLMVDLQRAQDQNPDIDFLTLKTATDKKIMSVTEFLTILQLYEVNHIFEPFQDRLIESFLTSDHHFCFSAFSGCLDFLETGRESQN